MRELELLASSYHGVIRIMAMRLQSRYYRDKLKAVRVPVLREAKGKSGVVHELHGTDNSRIV